MPIDAVVMHIFILPLGQQSSNECYRERM